jgi:hypothetical protein
MHRRYGAAIRGAIPFIEIMIYSRWAVLRTHSGLKMSRHFLLIFGTLIFSFQIAHADVAVTITANVSTAAFTVTGMGCAPGGYYAPQTLQWAPGASCTVAFVSPFSQPATIQYVLTGWQDGSTANPRVIVTPAQSTTYTASFKTQYQVNITANPPTGGPVSGHLGNQPYGN